jgi:toxin-antitoxin system PIN domain toxin
VIALLDINVLLAMLWPRHIFFHHASRWFAAHRGAGWATCPMSEAGMVRLYAQPAVMGVEISPQDALEVLEQTCAERDHVFWPQNSSIGELHPQIRQRLVGHKQLSDALLLDLAIRNGGRLVTFDKRVRSLLPAHSAHQAAIETIPVA